MKLRAIFSAVLAVVVIGLTALPARAERISIKGHSQDRVQGKCSGDGDVFWKRAGKDGTYGCLYADGSGIVCGGVTADDKKTCDTFKKASFPSPKLPTRGEAAKSGQ